MAKIVARATQRWPRTAETLIDVGWGLVWAALLVSVVLFSSGASEFIYIDF